MVKKMGMAARNSRELDEKTEKLREVKALLAKNAVKGRFSAILGNKSAQFCASLVNVVSGSEKLLECDPDSIVAAALVAATYDLPIDGNLGFSAIVPYKGKAQFQIMYKGFIQLAIRSGEYEKMNCSEVYEDELAVYNPITGECKFVTDFSRCSQRANGEADKIAGYYAWFRLLRGYTAELYMSRAEVENHAKKYSRSYQYDLRYGKRSSVWSTDFGAMAKKTVLKLLLSKRGILSIDIQRAVQDDQTVYGEIASAPAYADNPGPDILPRQPDDVSDPFAEENQADLPFAVDMEPVTPDDEEGYESENSDDEPEELDFDNM